MGKNKLSRSGMTLMELLITSVLVGIVTMGLIAAEQVIRMSRQSSSRDNLVSTQMQAMMLAMTNDVNMLTGDYADPGIYIASDASNAYIATCYRHAFGDINTYTDDRWNCWTFDRLGTGYIYSCKDLLTVPPPSNSCTGIPGYQTWNTPKQPKLALSPVVDPADGSIPAGYTGFITNKSILYIIVRLQARYDLNKPADPISNPDYYLESFLSPVGLSR